MNKGLMKKLLWEATSPECTDDRMMEICSIVKVNPPWALKEIGKLKTRYNNTWSSTSSTAEEVDVASVQHVQCSRLQSMLVGENVQPRLSVENVRNMGVH